MNNHLKGVISINNIDDNIKPLFTGIVVPEPHILNKNKTNRLDYVAEIKDYMNHVRDLHIKYKDHNLFSLFVGDIFDRGFSLKKIVRNDDESDLAEFYYWWNYFLELATYSKKMFTVIGNHELSFPNRNPFWYLINELSDKYKVRYKNNSLQAKGIMNLLNITDELSLADDIGLYFGHYGFYPRPNKNNKINLLLSHNDILTSGVVDLMEQKYDRNLLTKYINYVRLEDDNVLDGYDYAFIGHMHTAYAKYMVNINGRPCIVQNLGSLGRTNETEVNDKDLDRVIPIIQIFNIKQEGFTATSDMIQHGDYYIKIVDEPLTLKTRKEVIDLESVELKNSRNKAKEIYKECIDKEIEDVKPVADLNTSFTNPLLKVLFNASLEGSIPPLLQTRISLANRDLKIKDTE